MSLNLSLICLAINQSHEKFGSKLYLKLGLVVATVKKGSSGELGNCEKKAQVKFTMTWSDPRERFTNPLNPPVLNLMSSVTHLDGMRALIHR